MGMFTKGQEKVATTTYATIKQYLKPQDGNIHVVMINSFSKLANQIFQCEDKYTTQMDCILQGMQSEGYIIVDVKFNTLVGQGMLGDTEKYNTLIMYK